MRFKRLLCGVLCGGIVLGASNVVRVEAATNKSVSGTCGNTGVVGSATIARHSASAYTTQTGNSGTVGVDSTCVYRDVSAGEYKTLGGSKSATVSTSISFSVYEEDYMKSLKTTHTLKITNYKWSDRTTVSYTKY